MLEQGSRFHFVGIGGIGMSGLAKVLLEDGYDVTGSDLKRSELTDKLAHMGATVHQGHRAENLGEADLVVVSSAVPEDNLEVLEARRRGIEVIKRARLLGRMMDGRLGVAVAGTHGKTTTTGMVAMVLEEAGRDPTILAGGELIDLGTNAKRGTGPHLVAEADEYDASFLEMHPHVALVTNIEADHLDYYEDLQGIVAAFRRFLQGMPQGGETIVCADNDPAAALATEMAGAGRDITTYGLDSEDADWRAVDLKVSPAHGTAFTLIRNGEEIDRFSVRLPGRHNVSNAVAAFAAGKALGIQPFAAGRTLADFRGTRRRFEVKGEASGVTVVDDYAHHPTEIKATLRAARERFSQRPLWVIFQPHTYSRTKFLMQDFGDAFDEADQVIITDIYAAREKDDLGIHARDLVRVTSHPNVRYGGDLESAGREAVSHLRPGDVLFTVGAGDVWKLGEGLLELLAMVPAERDGAVRR